MKDKKNKMPKATSKPQQPAPGRSQAWRVAAVVVPLLGLIAIAAALLSAEQAYLFRVQELNLFMYTPLFFKQQLVVAGGFLTWLGTYFTQYFYHPALGVGLLCLWWALLMWLTKHAFRIPNEAAAVLLIPVVLLLITDVDLGYWICYLKFRGYFFAATIGTTVAVALLWAYRCMPERWQLRKVYIVVATAVAYPLFGFYGLLATALMAVSTWRLPSRARRATMDKAVSTAVAVAAIVIVPLFYYHFVYYQTPLAEIYRTALPVFTLEGEHNNYYIPFVLLTLVLLCFAACYTKAHTAQSSKLNEHSSMSKVQSPKFKVLSNLLVIAVLVVATYSAWYKDKNFHRELMMVHEVENLDWNGVLQTYQTLGDDEEPTRMMWMLKNLALFRLGTAGDDLYHYKNGDYKCPAPFQVKLTQTGGKPLYYHYGLLNYCYRWCLEDGVEYGWRVDYLKYMLKCAILNGEMNVARKYIDMLKTTKYYKDYALHYEPYLTHRGLISHDPEMKPILHFLHVPDQLGTDNTLVELYLLNTFTYSPFKPNDIVYREACLLAALQSKQIPPFWEQFSRFSALFKGKHMPTHYQEAAYLYGNLENKVDISHMPFDDEVKQTYNDFMAAAQQYSGMTEAEMKPLMYPRFGGTFYYEYFFIRGLKSY